MIAYAHLWIRLREVLDLDPSLFAFFWLCLLSVTWIKKKNKNKDRVIKSALFLWLIWNPKPLLQQRLRLIAIKSLRHLFFFFTQRWIEWEKSRWCLLVFLSPELLCAIIKELLIHLHEKLQSVVDEAVDGPANTHTRHTDTRRSQIFTNPSNITVEATFVIQQQTLSDIKVWQFSQKKWHKREKIMNCCFWQLYFCMAVWVQGVIFKCLVVTKAFNYIIGDSFRWLLCASAKWFIHFQLSVQRVKMLRY